jgi:formyltetrahydrofolate deformylase
MSSPPTLVALLHGPDQPGLVARVAGWIFERGGNILHADQHRDMESGIFFQRVEWQYDRTGSSADAVSFEAFAASIGMDAKLISSENRPRVVVFVSRADHCFHDLALRWRAGEFVGDLVGVVGNHADLESAARGYGLPFYHVPVSAETKSEAEGQQLELIRSLRADLVILARYMQVLSPGFLTSLARPVINIHHSFLPAFAGGRPYHQAHARGVKLIGATAHYATSELDEGPIIHQDVTRVTHRHDVADLIRLGRDLEKRVLAQAVRWHLDARVLAFRNKTVVFD